MHRCPQPYSAVKLHRTTLNRVGVEMNNLHQLVILGALILILIAGCAVKKVPKTTGGSREDGIREMSYEWGMFEDTEVQWEKARKKAVKRCKL